MDSSKVKKVFDLATGLRKNFEAIKDYKCHWQQESSNCKPITCSAVTQPTEPAGYLTALHLKIHRLKSSVVTDICDP